MVSTHIESKIKELALEPGATVSQIAREVGLCWTTVKRVLGDFTANYSCPCGRRLGHRGICTARSRDVTYSNTKVDVIRERRPTTEPIVEEEEDPSLSTGKCFEAACPFPAIRGGKCRRHYYELDYSLLASSLTPSDLFLYPDRYRNRRRK